MEKVVPLLTVRTSRCFILGIPYRMTVICNRENSEQLTIITLFCRTPYISVY